MCGIFLHNINDTNLSQKISNLLFHRGPDFQNFIKYQDFTIGQNLLSIRGDIENSLQPRVTKSKRYIFAFNGQIYNTKEICTSYNIDEQNNLDTAILADLIDIKGKDFISYIDGMFAIILIDTKTNKVFCYRDNSGQKPIYYYFNNKKIFICSEINPIAFFLKKELLLSTDDHGIIEGLTYGYNTGSNTIFKNVKKILPGEVLSFNNSYEKEHKNFIPNLSLKELTIPETIELTVKKHLQTKQKIAINLSGGIDSNIILYEALKFHPKIPVFSTQFETSEKKYNLDFQSAKQIAYDYQIPFYETNISKKDYIDNFAEAFEKIEEPNLNINNPAYYINYKNQSKLGFRSILSGDGGDEIFVGYDWYFNFKKLEKIFSTLNLLFINKIFHLEVFNFFREFKRYNFYYFNKNYVNKKIYNKNIIGNLNENSKNFQKYFSENYKSLKNLSWQVKKLLLQQFFWLSGEILLRADKLSMQNSMEVRNPFCDYNLRFRILDDLKDSDFNSIISKSKIRNLYKGKLSSIVTNNHSKQGWSIPQEWLVEKDLKNIVLDYIPYKNERFVKWQDIRNYIKSNNKYLLQKNMNSIISLAIIKKKYSLEI
jgi:asparagine synthase (glutamine-hydrolysing)